MERRGLLSRRECEADGRGAFIELTTAGADAIGAAAPRHVAAVRRLVFDRLSDAQRASFEEACAAIVTAAVRATLTARAPPIAPGDARAGGYGWSLFPGPELPRCGPSPPPLPPGSSLPVSPLPGFPLPERGWPFALRIAGNLETGPALAVAEIRHQGPGGANPHE